MRGIAAGEPAAVDVIDLSIYVSLTLSRRDRPGSIYIYFVYIFLSLYILRSKHYSLPVCEGVEICGAFATGTQIKSPRAPAYTVYAVSTHVRPRSVCVTYYTPVFSRGRTEGLPSP